MSGHLTLRNVRVVGGPAEPVDLAIDEGRIVRPSSEAGEVVDLGGRWIMPGLWDHHVHMNQWALATRRLDVSAAMSAREAADMVAAGLREWGAAGEVPSTFVASGFRDGLWHDLPTRELLDAVSPDIPVVLISFDLHATWLNTAALLRYGLSGDASGVFREDPAFEVTRLVNDVPSALLDRWVAEAGVRAASRGVVGIVDLEMTWNVDAWQRRMAAGFDSLRVEFGIYPQHLEQAIALGLRTGQQLGELLTVGRHKILTDGSLGTRTAYCFDPYPDSEGHEHPFGLQTVTPEELLPLLRRSRGAGLLATVHAIGDHANSHVLDVFEQLGMRGGRIEHAQLLARGDVERFGRMSLQASVQPEHAMDDRDIAERHWQGRTDRAFMLRSLLDAGADLLLGSDAPVAPLDPWVTVAAAVGRSRDGREPWHPEQAITVEEALDASVRTRIAVGQPADLVVLDADPGTLDADELRHLAVAATLLGGRWTHGRP